MGIHRPSRRTRPSRERFLSLTRVAQVVPDVPSFAVDGGFAYRVPPDLIDEVSVGSIVRVPLSGRRVRGYVVDVAEREDEGLKDVRSVSGVWSCFDRPILQTLRWAATHYVAPLSVVIAKTAPPNLPRRAAARKLPSIPPAFSPIPDVSDAAQGGTRVRQTQILSGSDWPDLIRRSIAGPLSGGRSAVVVAPTVVEVAQLADTLGGDFGSRVVEVADQSDATITTAWSVAAAQGGLVVVGTPRVAWWPVKNLSMMVLVEDGRRGMKERQTPAVAVRSIARQRGAVEGLAVVHIGRVPTTEALSDGIDLVKLGGRLWPLVEVIDRTEEPPGGGVVTQRARAAIAGVAGRGERVFVFTHRHGYAPASRCGTCRALRTCTECGARPDPGTTCARCGAPLGACQSCGGRRFEPLGAAVGRVIEELRRVVGHDGVGGVDDSRRVTVGTERDLVGLEGVALSVAVDADGLVRGTNYRSGEDALALLARVAAAVTAGRGRRMMLQTADPRHPLYAALRRADPVGYLTHELTVRAQLSLPPVGEVIVLEVGGTDDHSALEGVFDGVSAFGPAQLGDRWRWLIQGADLGEVRVRLTRAVAKLRDRGARVRIDVDPRDL